MLAGAAYEHPSRRDLRPLLRMRISKVRPPTKLARLVQVVLWMAGTLLSFSALAVAVRSLAGALSVFEILAARSFVGLAILIAVGAAQPALRRSLSLRRINLHIARNTIHFVGQYLWAFGLTVLPLATVFALEFTMPAFTVLLAILTLGERVTASRLGVIVLGLAGTLVILRPGLGVFQPNAILVVGAAFVLAVSLILLKRLTSTESSFAIVFFMNLIQLPLALFGSDPFFPLRLEPAGLVAAAALGFFGLSAHFCLAKAFAAGDASLVVPIDFLRLPLIAVVGWLLYGEALDPFVFAGSALIIGGILWNLHAEARAARTEDTE
jgi:drug/metabolite transporter (DMT)-like permease